VEPPLHEPRPDLYGPLLARFEPTPGERRIGRWLLGLLRFPGAAWLLRAWHARRAADREANAR
jgi:hypothetical protein